MERYFPRYVSANRNALHVDPYWVGSELKHKDGTEYEGYLPMLLPRELIHGVWTMHDGEIMAH